MKLLFVHKSMNMGGIEKSLISLTAALANNNKIDVLLLNDTFGKELFNCKINFLKSNKYFRLINPQKSYSKGQQSMFGIVKAFVNKFGVRAILEYKFAKAKVIEDKYDTAVAFHGQDYVTCYQVAKMVEANKKIVFLHFDVSKVKIKKRVLNLYHNFDKIICVSKSIAENFKAKYPNLSDRVDYLYNMCDTESIILKSHEFDIKYPHDTFNIVSVSRLSEEKAHIRSLKVFKKLKNEGFNFHWHVVGDGEDRKRIEKFIKQNAMQDYVTLYGNQSNPYPYIKSADLFYLGSYHESFGISLIESMILGIPTVSTKTISAVEVVGDNGLICGNNEQAIENTLRMVLKKPEKLERYKNKPIDYRFDNDAIIQKFYKL